MIIYFQCVKMCCYININTLEPGKVTDIFEWFFRKYKNVFDSNFFPVNPTDHKLAMQQFQLNFLDCCNQKWTNFTEILIKIQNFRSQKASENIVWEMAAILSSWRWVKLYRIHRHNHHTYATWGVQKQQNQWSNVMMNYDFDSHVYLNLLDNIWMSNSEIYNYPNVT